ncbi:shikimate kinase [Flammeovirga sp. MY04]|uniref:shikimate kinase n=1 Tax=Flammeovirga sp. MY04 TaxID=1191459 RepID=UPI0008264E2D|nr:shikimate kinase [Flammeovirga sp. MY04]ANQ49428.2 shikimate kinase [Flammeovirga sp. MY04]
MRIYLVGMPGSGKSTLAKALSEQLDLPFYDMDDEIVNQENRSIPEIFEKEGEEYFRKVEQQIVQNFHPENSIIATGGGAPCFFDNMEVLNGLGITVFTDVSAEALTERVWGQHGTRPLLSQSSKEEVFQSIDYKRSDRLPYYKKAQIYIEAKDKTPEDLAIEIANRLKEIK